MIPKTIQRSTARLLCWPVLLALVVLAGCGRNPQNAVFIGGVLPLTGDAATFGRNASRGASLAVREANDHKLAPTGFEFRAEDSQGTPAGAAAVARKLLDLSHAEFLIGDVTSAGTQALIPIITPRKVLLVSPSASDPALSNSSPYFVRVWPSDVYEAEVIGKYAQEKTFHKIAVIYANTDYGLAMVDQFKKAVGQITTDPAIATNRETMDYRATLQRIRNSKPDALFIVLYPEDASRLLQQATELGLNVPLLATATFEDPKLLKVSGTHSIVFASPVPPDNTQPERSQFLAAYKKQYGEDAGVLSDTGYDAAMILIKAYVSVGKQGPDAIAGYIKNLKQYPGISGTMTFDAGGDVRKPYKLRTIRGNRFDWLRL